MCQPKNYLRSVVSVIAFVRRCRFRVVALTVAALAGSLLLAASPAQAQTSIQWSSTAATTTWTTGSNWLGGVAPANDLTTNTAVFDQTSYLNWPSISSNLSINGIQIGDGTTATAPLFITDPNTLTIGAGGISMFANAGPAGLGLNIYAANNNPVALGASQIWTNNSANAFTSYAQIYNNSNSSPTTLTFAGSGSGGFLMNGSGYGGYSLNDGAYSNAAKPSARLSVVVDMTGNGAVALPGNNNFSGGLTIQAGTVISTNNSNNNQFLGLGTITLGDANPDSANAALINTNYNSTTVSTSNSIALNNGTTGSLILGAGVYTYGAWYNSFVTSTFSGAISGSNNLTIGAGNALGTVVLSGVSSGFTGNLAVGGGGLNLTGSVAAAALTMSGGTLFNYAPVAGGSQTLGALSFALGDATVQSTYGSSNTTLTFASATRNSGVGATGNFVVSGGANGSTNRIVLSGQATNSFIDPGVFFGGGTTGATYAYYDAGGYVRGINYTTDPNTVNVTVASSSGVGAVNSSAPYSNVQVGNVAISGQPTAQISTLQLGTSSFALASGATFTTNGILKAGNSGGGTISGGTLQPGNNADLVVRTDMASDTLTISSAIGANGTNALVKSGAGSVTISNGTVNNLTGGLFVNAGTLFVSTDSALGASGAGITFNGGTLKSTASSFALDSTRPITVNAGISGLWNNAASSFAVANPITGTGTLFFGGQYNNSTYVISGNNSGFSGTLAAYGRQSLQFQGPNSTGTGQIGFSNWDGGTYPTLKLRNDSSTTFAASNLHTGQNGTFTFDVGPITSGAAGTTLTLQQVTGPDGNGSYNFTSSSGYNMAITTYVANGTLALNPTTASVAIGTINGTIGSYQGTPALGLGGTASGNTINSINAQGNYDAGGVVVSGGTWTVTGVNNLPTNLYTSVTGGMLSVSADYNLGTTPTSATAGNVILTSGVLFANSSFTLSPNRGIAIGAASSSTGGSATISVANGATLNYNGVIATGSGNTGVNTLSKSGPGTLVLGGASTYNGGLTVNGGTLVAANTTGSATGTGTVTVGAAGTLTGTGIIGAPVAVNSGTLNGTLTINGPVSFNGTSIFNPGNGDGASALTINNTLSLGASSVSNFSINGTSSYNQVLGLTAAPAYGGTLDLYAPNGYGFFAVGQTYQLFSNTGPGTGSMTVGTTPLTTELATENLEFTPVNDGAVQLVYINAPKTQPDYTLGLLASGAASAFGHVNGQVSLSTTITNQGGGGQSDSVIFSGLGATAGSGTLSTPGNSSGTLTYGSNQSTTGLQYSNSTPGTYTVTATVASVLSPTGTPQLSGSVGQVSIQIYTGQSTWSGNGSGAWGTFTSLFGVNWGANQGSPGLDPSFQGSDTATFNDSGLSSPGSSATVSLNGASPSLNVINFNTSSGGSYTIAQGSGGMLTMNGAGAAINVTGSHTISAPMTLASDTTVTPNTASDSLLVSGPIGGSGNLIVAGSGLVTLGGSNSYAGTTINSGATVQVGSGGASGTLGGGPVSNNGTLVFNRADAALVVPGNIGGAGSVSQTGSGMTTISGTNTYGGGTNINAGILEFGQAASLPTSGGSVTVAPGALLAVAGNTAGGSAGWSGSDIVNLLTTNIGFTSGAALGIDTSNAGGTFTCNSVIGDANGGTASLAVVKIGTGTLALGGNNTFSGGLQVNSGIVSFTTDANLGASGGSISFNGGELYTTNGAATLSASRTITVNSGGGTIWMSSASNLPIQSQIVGTGTLTLGGPYNNNAYIISGNNIGFSGSLLGYTRGTLQFDGPNSTGAGQAGFTNWDGGASGVWPTLQLRNDTSTTFLCSNFNTGTSHNNVYIDVGPLTSGAAGTTLTLNQVTVPGGSFDFNITSSAGYNLGIGTLTVTPGYVTYATLSPTTAGVTVGTIASNGGGYPLILGGTSSGTVGSINMPSGYSGGGTPSVTVTGGVWTLTGSSGYTVPTTISGGTLQFAKEVSLYNNVTANWTAANIIVGSGAMAAFNVGGPGEFTSGDLDTLQAMSSGTATGFTSGSMLGLDTTNAAGGNFAYASNIANPNGGANVLGLVKLGGNTLTLSGNNTYTGPTIVNAGVLALASPTGPTLGSSAVTISGGTLDASFYPQTVSSLMVGPLGALNLSSTNLFTSNALASLNGTLDVLGPGAAEELMSLPASYSGSFSTTNVPPGYTLQYNPLQLDLVQIGVTAWSSSTNGSWNGPGNWSYGLVPSSGTLLFPVVAGTTAPITVTLDGNQSAGALVFNVSGSNGYTLSQGTGNGALTLGTTGSLISVLSGTHTISAPVVLTGSLAVSTSGGGVLDLAGSISEATPGTGAIVLNAGELILNGTGSYTGGTTVNGGTMYLMNAAAINAIAGNTTLTVNAGGTFIFDPNGPAPSVVSASHAASAVEAVPEPGTLALLIAGLAVGFAARRSRRRS